MKWKQMCTTAERRRAIDKRYFHSEDSEKKNFLMIQRRAFFKMSKLVKSKSEN